MAALTCLAQILGGGNTSILYQQLVKPQLALQANVYSQLFEAGRGVYHTRSTAAGQNPGRYGKAGARLT